jgi:hypothetical protein
MKNSMSLALICSSSVCSSGVIVTMATFFLDTLTPYGSGLSMAIFNIKSSSAGGMRSSTRFELLKVIVVAGFLTGLTHFHSYPSP